MWLDPWFFKISLAELVETRTVESSKPVETTKFQNLVYSNTWRKPGRVTKFPKMPSCKKIGAFGACVGMTIAVFIFYLAFVAALWFGLFGFGNTYIGGLIYRNVISEGSCTTAVLKGGILYFILSKVELFYTTTWLTKQLSMHFSQLRSCQPHLWDDLRRRPRSRAPHRGGQLEEVQQEVQLHPEERRCRRRQEDPDSHHCLKGLRKATVQLSRNITKFSSM